ncbi:T9SS type A sorting domain-containing protein [Flammeovirga sp. SJP92]|uniref:T9SS type A sorting domain-containing protein n=1 Tax=Flammeovirga sp. SJP92 TaxID=1775430 RepID=UPI000786DDF0|nr:T9SS type A sorting domain-containing protein [Flammeovirga sp. SJP92]KXX72203.1 hypothetical protein AVL50_00975 [Flammeovirga sp. SJP92]
MRSKLLLLFYFVVLSSLAQAEEFSHGVPILQYEALIEFYDSLGGDYWKRNENWKSDLDVSEWYGVELSTFIGENGESYQAVSTIAFYSNNVRGHIPSSIADIKTLHNLTLQRNDIFSIPKSIYTIEGLYSLNLYGNRISYLPEMQTGQWAYLERLDLQNNLLSFEDYDNIHLSNIDEREDIKLYSIYDDFNEERALFATYDIVNKQITLSSKIGGENSQYKWYKNGQLIELATESITYNYEENLGVDYYCEISNSDYGVVLTTKKHKQRLPYKITLTTTIDIQNLIDPYFYVSGPFEDPFVRMEKTDNGYECWVEPTFDNFDIAFMYFKDNYRREISQFLTVSTSSSSFSSDNFEWNNSNENKLNVPPLELRAWDKLRASSSGDLNKDLGREYLNDNFEEKDIYGHEYTKTDNLKLPIGGKVSYLVLGDYIKYLPHLKTVNLSSLALGDIDGNAFETLSKLESITFTDITFNGNCIQKLPALPSLQSLTFDGADGSTFLSNKLTHLENLETLNIWNSRIGSIEGDLPKSLKNLIINNSTVENYSFLENAVELTKLSLLHQNLTEIPKETYKMPELYYFDVSYNALDLKDYETFVANSEKDVNRILITMSNQKNLSGAISYKFDYDSLHLIAIVDPKFADPDKTMYSWRTAKSSYFRATTDTNMVRIPMNVVNSGYDLSVSLHHKYRTNIVVASEDEKMRIPQVIVGLPANEFTNDLGELKLSGDFDASVVKGEYDEKTNHYYFRYSTLKQTDTYSFVLYLDQNTIKEEVNQEGNLFERFLIKEGVSNSDTVFVGPIQGWSDTLTYVGDLHLSSYRRLKRLYSHFGLSEYSIFDNWFSKEDLSNWTALEFTDFEGGDGRIYKDVYGIGFNSLPENYDKFHGDLPSFIADFNHLHHLHMSYQSITDISPVITHKLSSYQINLYRCKIKPSTYKRIYEENQDLPFFDAISFRGQRGDWEEYNIRKNSPDSTFVYSVSDQLDIDEESFEYYWDYFPSLSSEYNKSIEKSNANIGEAFSFNVKHTKSDRYYYTLPRVLHNGIEKTIIIPRSVMDPDTLFAEGIINEGAIPLAYDKAHNNWYFSIPEYVKQSEILFVTKKDNNASYELNENNTYNIRTIDLTVDKDTLYLESLNSFSEPIFTDYMPVLEYAYCQTLMEELGSDNLENLFKYSNTALYVNRHEYVINNQKYLFTFSINDNDGKLKRIPEGIKYCVRLETITSRYSKLKEIPPLLATYNNLTNIDFYRNKLTFYELNKLNARHVNSSIKEMQLDGEAFHLIQVGDTIKIEEGYQFDPKTIFRWKYEIGSSTLRIIETQTPYVVLDKNEITTEHSHYLSLKLLNEDNLSIQLKSDRLRLEKDIVNDVERSLFSTFSPFPNPFKDRISIDPHFKVIDIYTVNGQLVYSSKNYSSIDLSHLQRGVYFLKATSDNVTKQYKIIKK